MPELRPDIVLGTAQLGSAYGIANRSGRLSRRSAVELLQAGAAAGVAAFDTAPRYGDAEELIGGSDTQTAVFTKVAIAEVESSVIASLARLQRERIDVLFLHDPAVLVDDPADIIWQAEQLVGDIVGALGVATYTPAEFDAAVQDDRITHVQAPVSVADRRLVTSGALGRATQHGKAVYARSALLQGSLVLEDDNSLPTFLMDLVPIRGRVRSIAADLNMSPHDLLLGFVGSLPIAGVLIGCETIEQLAQDVRSLQTVSLSDDVVAELLTLPQPEEGVIDPRTWPLP